MELYCIFYFHLLCFLTYPPFTSSSHTWCEYFSKFSPCHSVTSVNFFLHDTSLANSFKIEPTCVFLSLSFPFPSLKIKLLIFNYLCIISTWSFLYTSVSHKPYLTLAFPHNNYFQFLWRYKFSIHVTFKNRQAHIWKPSFCLWFICFPDGIVVKNPPINAGDTRIWVWSLGQEDSLEEEMATHSSTLA